MEIDYKMKGNVRKNKKEKIVVLIFLLLAFIVRFIMSPEYASAYSLVCILWNSVIFVVYTLKLIFLKAKDNDNPQIIKQNNWGKFFLLILVLTFIIYILYNFYSKGVSVTGFNNFRKILNVFLISPFFIWMSKKFKVDEMINFVKYISFLMNLYFIINIPIMIVEHVTGSFLVSRFLSLNPYLSDQVTGFIGINGTAIMCLYWVSLLIFNFMIYMVEKKNSRLALIIFEFISMFLISQYYSEIKNFVPTVIVSVIVLLIIQVKSNMSRRFVGTIIGAIIIGSILFMILYTVSSQFRELMTNFLVLYEQLKVGNGNGSDIRIHTFWVAYTFLRGIGFSNINFSNQSYAGQLDVTSLNVLMIYGGVFFILLTIILMAHILSFIVNQHVLGSYFWTDLGLSLLIFYFCIITVPFQDDILGLFIYFISLGYHGVIQIKQRVID